MSNFTLSRFKFTIQLNKSGILPPYKGSVIRGALGHALRDIACKRKTTSCQGCEHISSCLFVKLFKPDQKKGMSIPASYMIDPPALKKTDFLAGYELCFYLTLFGWADQYINTWINAVKLCGEKYGLGAGRIPFILKHVECIPFNDNPVIIYNESGFTGSVSNITFAQLNDQYPPVSGITMSASVRMLTPFKIKHQGSVTGSITGSIFIGALLQRLNAISRFYQDEIFPLYEYSHFAEHVLSECHALKWVTLERRSINHPAHINLGGLTGSFILNNLSAELIPLLKLGEFVHAGKNTVYGCGKYRITIL